VSAPPGARTQALRHAGLVRVPTERRERPLRRAPFGRGKPTISADKSLTRAGFGSVFVPRRLRSVGSFLPSWPGLIRPSMKSADAGDSRISLGDLDRSSPPMAGAFATVDGERCNSDLTARSGISMRKGEKNFRPGAVRKFRHRERSAAIQGCRTPNVGARGHRRLRPASGGASGSLRRHSPSKDGRLSTPHSLSERTGVFRCPIAPRDDDPQLGSEKVHKSALRPLKVLSRVTLCASRPGERWSSQTKTIRSAPMCRLRGRRLGVNP